MRRILYATVLFPACAFADQIDATSRISEVTIYAQGARVTREISFDAPAGTHDLILDDLPNTVEDGTGLRILPGTGLIVGAFSVSNDGIPSAEPRRSNAQRDADARVMSLEAEERKVLGIIDAIATRIDAADAQSGFLRTLGAGDTDLAKVTPEGLQALAGMIGSEVTRAAEGRAAALSEKRSAEAELARVQTGLERARSAAASLDTSDQGENSALRISVTTATQGPAQLRVAYFVDAATWAPVYDIDLARKAGKMTVSRGVVVNQLTGEDWSEVALTLSTARPGEQSAPSSLYPDLRRIEPETPPQAEGSYDAMAPSVGGMPEPVMEPAVVESRTSVPSINFVGDTVVYTYNLPVSLSSGVENLRLNLGDVELSPKLQAVAVPSRDRTAYLNATATNTSAEILLPGTAMLSRDGALIAEAQIDTVAPGADFELSFGPIDGLRLSRTEPVRAEGERGILTSSSQIEESATLKVENLTDEAWEVRVLDQVPYSEQEDLQITYSATPEPDETRVDNQRGILAWNKTMQPGETKEIKLDHLISWPEGMVLQ